MITKTKKVTQWILTGVIVLIFIGSGIFKLTGGEATIQMAKSVGGVSNLTSLAILEFAIVLLFIIPRTALIGSLLIMAYMGGAMAVLLANNQSIIAPTIIQILIWGVSFYRFPELKQRLINIKN
ncbi:DoxX family protein [Flavobacterium maritimum]|uniref:DoxX family protein n=1 Tax=Flavobacterium maritimum TaxID=3149042 RepID=UPI0032B5CF2A